MNPADVSLDDLADDPHPHLDRLRHVAPAVYVPAIGGFVVTERQAAVDVLRDPATFTVDDPRFTTALVVGPSMLSLDGDDHRRHRQPFVAPFRPRRVSERFGAGVVRHVERRVAAVVTGDGHAEIRRALAGPVAASVVADALGLDGGDDGVVDELLAWYRAIVDSVSGAGAGNPVTAAGESAMSALAAALRALIDSGDRTSLLAEVADHAELSVDEVVSNAAVVMFGGIETTEAMILNALWFMLRSGWRPAGPGPGAVADAVEESLRLEPAAAEVDRYATADTEIGATAIPAGSFVAVSLAAANRDPAEFADPHRFDPERANLRRQLAFATGPHVCLGMDLARLETCVAVAALLDALPDARLDESSPAPSGLVFRKPDRLVVRWSAHE